MEAAFAELPLACFTTLAPLGAGAFIALFLANLMQPLSDADRRRIDMLTLVPLGFLLLAFGLAFLHLANPLHAPFVLSGLGSSPLSNELLVGSAAFALMGVYWVLAMMGRLGKRARLVFSLITALAALAFALFIGLAYYIDTSASWHTPLIWVQMVGIALMGAGLTGSLVLAAARVLPVGPARLTKVLAVVGGVGFVLFIGAFLWWIEFVSTLSNPLSNGARMVEGVEEVVIAAVACAFIGIIILLALLHWRTRGPRKAVSPTTTSGAAVPEGAAPGVSAAARPRAGRAVALLIMALAWGVVGVFAARLVFYALQMNVGLL